MNTGEQVKIDFYKREEWGKGPWDDEPDYEVFYHNGNACMIVRNNIGALCGYAAVYPDHPDFGKNYDEVETIVSIHGGLTYSDKCQGHICHVPKPDEKETWWFGFDCAHSYDLVPGMDLLLRSNYQTRAFMDPTSHDFGSNESDRPYRNIEYVREEVKKLSEQLHSG